MIIFDVLITLTGEVFIALSWHGLWTISDALQQIFDHETSVSAWYSLVSRKRFRLLQKGVKGGQNFYVFFLRSVDALHKLWCWCYNFLVP